MIPLWLSLSLFLATLIAGGIGGGYLAVIYWRRARKGRV